MRNGVIAAIAAGSVLLFAAPGASGATGGTAIPIITTVAGGPGGPATGTTVAIRPCGVSSAGGFVYVSDGGTVRQLDTTTDMLTTVAGVGRHLGVSGYFGNDSNGVQATTATMNGACGTATDRDGNLLIAEQLAGLVRVVAGQTGTFYGRSMIAGRIYTIAGGGTSLNNTGPALKTKLYLPQAVTTDQAGNVVITDTGSDRVRVVAESNGTFYGQTMRTGYIYTVFYHVGSLQHTAVDQSGNLVVADNPNNALFVVAESTGSFYGQQMTAGKPYAIARLGSFNIDEGVAVDGSGNVVFGNRALVQVVAASTGSFYGQSMTVGHVYTIAGDGNYGYAGDGRPALQTGINPVGVAVDGSGNVVIGDGYGNFGVRVVATTTGTFYGQPMTVGDIYTVAGNGSQAYSGTGGPAHAAELAHPESTAVDGWGNVLIADNANFTVRVIAARNGNYYGQQMTGGDIYTIAGTGIKGYGASGGPATATAMLGPTGVALDSRGNVIITDISSTFPVNDVDVLAEHTGWQYGIKMTTGSIYRMSLIDFFFHALSAQADHYGNLVVTTSDTYYGPPGVYVLAFKSGVFYGRSMTKGSFYLIAGGNSCASPNNGIPALHACVEANQVVVDPSGNLVLADSGLDQVRVIALNSGIYYGRGMKAGYIYDVAGNGKPGPGSNGIPAPNAQLTSPQSVAVDHQGNLVIADSGDNQIRVVAGSNGMFYGQQMKVGYIYLLSGTGRTAFGGDGGPASLAWMDYPTGVSVSPAGDIAVADEDRIRLIDIDG